MSIEEEIAVLEAHRLHLKLQPEMVEKRVNGLKTVGR